MRWDDLSPGELTVLETVFWSSGASRSLLVERSSFSKSKANAAAAALLERGLLEEGGPRESSGGRRPETLHLSRALGALAAIDLGATSLDVALLAPDMTLLAHHGEPTDVRAGPAVVMSRVRELLRELLQRCKLDRRQVLAVGMGVPGPVAFDTGLLVNPPIMPGWEGFSIREVLGEDYAAPVYVDNDVNVMALAELWRLERRLPNFLVVKVGTGIGCGIVCHGEVYRGANGSAGDVGHICVAPEGPRCHCGNTGCVEAMAAGPAIARRGVEAAEAGRSPALAAALRTQGSLSAIDVGRASQAGDQAAITIVREAGGWIGQMLAAIVNFFNPSHVFIGGGVAHIGPLFLAAIRQSVYHRSLALSTRHLEIAYAPQGERAGVVGAGVLALQQALRAQGAQA